MKKKKKQKKQNNVFFHFQEFEKVKKSFWKYILLE